MSRFLYNTGIFLLTFIIRLGALFKPVWKQWLADQHASLNALYNNPDLKNHQVALFHCASLGEFEQGRPVIEEFRKEFPEWKIVVSFFSPSGYTIRKDYEGADAVIYIPFDTPGNAKKFVKAINPSLAIFVKYEFWYNLLHQLHQNGTPIFLISSIFRENQLFFKPYGGLYRKMLGFYKQLFVQNEASKNLLNTIGVQHVEVSGDTRFDRVLKVREEKKEIAIAKAFKNEKPLFIIGSSWPEDMTVLTPVIHAYKEQIQFIIAPHKIYPAEIEKIGKDFNAALYSKTTIENVPQHHVLIIDTIGVLSSLYQYAEWAYIGGGFGKGIHNTLEAATFGMPLFFGPNYKKFQEAKDLIDIGVAKRIQTPDALIALLQQYLADSELLHKVSEKSRSYVNNRSGTSDRIIQACKQVINERINH